MKKNLYNMSNIELSKYAKEFFKARLESLGFNLVDINLGNVDACVKTKDKYYKFKVKSIRKPSTGYIKIKKKDVDIDDESLFISTILFYDTGISDIFLIPAADLENDNDLFRNRDYHNLKSTPEWGLNVTEKNMDILNQYKISKVLEKLI